MVLVECGGVEAKCFPHLQQVASVELGLETVPVTSPDHAAKYLKQVVSIKILMYMSMTTQMIV